ncbi:unnamed protein product [Closterium sp. NIES-54]
MAAAKRVLRYLCSTSGMGLVLGGRRPVVLTGHADASWADDQATQRSSQGYTFSLGSGSVSWRSTRSSSVLSSSCEAEIYAGAMAAQELRWLTYLLTDLGEQPRSPPVLYVDNKAMLALCREHRLEHRTKHIALRYFLARELQQRGQLRLAYVASEANTADIFTKALAPGDHQRLCTLLDCVVFLLQLDTLRPSTSLWLSPRVQAHFLSSKLGRNRTLAETVSVSSRAYFAYHRLERFTLPSTRAIMTLPSINVPKMPRAASELLNGSYFGSRSARESLPTLSTQSSSLSDRSLSTRSEPALSSGGEMAELEHQSSAGRKAQARGEAEGGKTAQQKQQWGAWHAQVQQLWGSSSQLLARYTSGGKVASLENNCAMQSAWNPVGAQGESDRPQHVVIYICESYRNRAQSKAVSKPLLKGIGNPKPGRSVIPSDYLLKLPSSHLPQASAWTAVTAAPLTWYIARDCRQIARRRCTHRVGLFPLLPLRFLPVLSFPFRSDGDRLRSTILGLSGSSTAGQRSARDRELDSPLREPGSSLLSGALRDSCATLAPAPPIPPASSSHRFPLHRVRALSDSGSVTSVETSKPLQAAADEERTSQEEERGEGRGAERGRDAGGKVEREKAPNQAKAEVAGQQEKETDKEEKKEEEGKKEEKAERGEEEEGDDPEVEAGFKMSRVCDRLVDVFWVEKPEPAQWRLLLAFSAEWARIRPHFFARAKLRAREFEEQGKPDKAAELYRLARRLKEVRDECCWGNG